MVDATDSKSVGPQGRRGSSPLPGTKRRAGADTSAPALLARARNSGVDLVLGLLDLVDAQVIRLPGNAHGRP